MRCSQLVVSIVGTLLSASVVVAAGERGAAPTPPTLCPVSQRATIPAAYAVTDAPGAATAPFVSDPTSVPRDDDGRHARYQHWLAPGAFSGPVSVRGVQFRIDASTPLADVPGDLTYALEVSAGTGPATAAELSSVLADNAAGLSPVFDATVAIAGDADDAVPVPTPTATPVLTDDVPLGGAPGDAPGETVEIVFESPVVFDPGAGGLLVDVRIVGLSGGPLPIALDAATDPSAVALFTPDETSEPAVALPAAPVLTLELVPGEPLVDVATPCLEQLPLDGGARNRLARILDGTRRAALRDNLRAVARRLEAYRESVDRLASTGDVPPEVATDLDGLGVDEALAYDGGLGALRALAALAIRNEFGLGFFNVERISTPFLPRGRRGRELRAQTQLVDAAVDTAFANTTTGILDTEDWDEVFKGFCDLLEKAKAEKSADEDLIEVYEDLKQFAADLDELNEMLEALIDMLGNGTIDKNDIEHITTLKKALKKVRKRLKKGGEVRKGVDQLNRFLCSLAALLDSGKLVSITLDEVDGKAVFAFDVTKPVKIRLLELLELDTESDYGTTNLYFELTIKEDAEIRFCEEDELDKLGNAQGTFDFDPDDAFDLDIDSSGWWVVHVLEDLLGIPDLDKVCISEIRSECGMAVITAESDGQEVEIEIDSTDLAKRTPKKSGVTVKVDGKQTFPRKR